MSQPSRDQRTNRRIRAREVRLVGAGGEQLGVVPTDQALAKAQEAGLDLVEVNPMSKPPVCKIMDYGKFKYDEKKRANETKKKQVVVKVKEVKLRPKTEDHDYDFKVRNIKGFLEEGNKAKVTIMFRGREITHRNLGQKILDDILVDTKDVAIVESPPRMEGRSLYMIIAPNPKLMQRMRDQARHQQQLLAQQEKAAASAAYQKKKEEEALAGGDKEKPAPKAAPPTPSVDPTPAAVAAAGKA